MKLVTRSWDIAPLRIFLTEEEVLADLDPALAVSVTS